jgi:outer membrane protein TolC
LHILKQNRVHGTLKRSLAAVVLCYAASVTVRAVAEDAGTQTSLPPAPTAQLTLPAGVVVRRSVPAPLSLTLDQAVDLGLQQNLQVELDNQTHRQLHGLTLTAFNALIPSLSASAQTSVQEINLAALGFSPETIPANLLPDGFKLATIVKLQTTGAQINLNQQIFNLPAFEIYRASKETVRAQEFSALMTDGDVVQRVATQYLQILADATTISNKESLLKVDRELERQAREKHDAGVGTNLDLLRAQVQRQNREQELITARNTFAKDKIALNRLMGEPADQELQLVDEVPYHELEMMSIEEAKQIAYQRRKDLLNLEAQQRSLALQRKAITFERLPAVTLSGYYGVLGETHGLYHGIFNTQAGLDFPIFQEARIRGDAKVADAQISHIRSQVASLRNDIEQQIRAAMLDVNSSAELVRVSRSNVDLATETVAETNDRYRAGVDDTLPVVRALATLAGAQSQFVNALFQFNQAKLNLARNTGIVQTQYKKFLGN